MEDKKGWKVYSGLNGEHLAMERTVLAYERTLMAWVRTAVSMISFGFTIYKFFEEITRAADSSNRIFSPRLVGLLMISFGFLSLLFAQIQHETAIKRLKREYPEIQRSIATILSVLILIFGLGLFMMALFRQ
jgi:putative membrane protein